MTSTHQKLPQPGQIARVRQRLYLVEKVTKGKSVKDATLVSMSCVDDDAQGQPLDALWENEIEAEIISGENWDVIAQKGLDEPGTFSAYLNTLKWNCVTATNPKLFQSPFRAGIKLEAYQLEPLRKALRLPRVNGLTNWDIYPDELDVPARPKSITGPQKKKTVKKKVKKLGPVKKIVRRKVRKRDEDSQ